MRAHRAMKGCLLILLLVLGVAGCDFSLRPLFQQTSPSGRFILSILSNEEPSNRTRHHCLRLVISDKDRKVLSVEQMGASNYQRWVAGWMPGEDVVVIHSQDIGRLAYRITNDGKFAAIPVTPAIDSRADELWVEFKR